MPMDYYGMEDSPLAVIAGIWGLWIVSWFIAALWAARTQARPPLGSQTLYRIITLVGVAALFDQWGGYRGNDVTQLWTLSPTLSGVMIALTAAGFSFCWWARIYLGRLWSSSVTRKEDHHIVDTGPYALVRHPIYTGIIVASAATAAVRGTVASLVGLALVILGCWIKARLEERFLRSELGADAYDRYASRTGMLFPFL
jgi:protein-S-isoprenylcysteine O-methyltransferase Ste14